MKGTLGDLLIIAIIALMVGIVAAVGFIVTDTVSKVQAINSTPHFEDTMNNTKSAMILSGNMVLFFIIMSGIATAIGAFFIRDHPIFFAFSLIIFSVMLVIFGILSSFYTTIYNIPQFTAVFDLMPMYKIAMDNLPKLMLGVFIVVAIALYARRGGDQTV